MKRKRNMKQIKENGKTPQDQMKYEGEVGSLPVKKEFRAMIVRMSKIMVTKWMHR